MRFNEAIDTGEHGHLFHPSKQAKYETPQDVEKLFPNLGPEAKRYIEVVTGEAYQKAIERLQHYTGKNPAQLNLPTLMSTVMSSLQKVMQLQSGHKEELEELAVNIVLELPEFKAFKKWKESGLLKFDAKLEQANLNNAIVQADKEGQEEEGGEDLTPTEDVDLKLAENIGDASDGALKRKFANMITQGNAVNKLYLFQLANENLNQIDPSLSKLYGILSSIVQTSYYAMPDMTFSNSVKDAAVGSEEVIPEENGYVIKARSPFFPYLVHEIVKGCWDLLAIDIASQEELAGETLDDEVMDIMSGPQLYTNMAKLVPNKDMEYLPYVYRLLLKQDVNTLREVLSGGGRGQAIMNKLLSQAKEMQSEYDQSTEDKYTDSEDFFDSEENEESDAPSKKNILAGLDEYSKQFKEFEKKSNKFWQFVKEYDTEEGLFVVGMDVDYSEQAVDYDSGDGRGRGRDIYAMVPSDITDYIVYELDDDGNPKPVHNKEIEKKFLNKAWIAVSTDPDNYKVP